MEFEINDLLFDFISKLVLFLLVGYFISLKFISERNIIIVISILLAMLSTIPSTIDLLESIFP